MRRFSRLAGRAVLLSGSGRSAGGQAGHWILRLSVGAALLTGLLVQPSSRSVGLGLVGSLWRRCVLLFRKFCSRRSNGGLRPFPGLCQNFARRRGLLSLEADGGQPGNCLLYALLEVGVGAGGFGFGLDCRPAAQLFWSFYSDGSDCSGFGCYSADAAGFAAAGCDRLLGGVGLGWRR